VDFSYGCHPISLHTIYAPAPASARADFYRALSTSAFSSSSPSPERCHILCGDFNTTLDPLDRTRRGRSTVAGAAQLHDLVAHHQLVDVWRNEHPRACDFTYFSPGRVGEFGTGVRLDRFYVGAVMAGLERVQSEILPTSPIETDHLPVSLSLPGPPAPDPHSMPRWHFPLFVLTVPELQDRLRSWITSTLSSATPSVNRWSVFKALLRIEVDKLARRYQEKLQREIIKVDKAAATARGEMVKQAERGDAALLLLHQTAWHAHRRAAEGLQQQRSMTREAMEEVRQLLFGSQGVNIYKGETRLPTRIPFLHDLDAPEDASSSDAADLSTSVGMGRAYTTFEGHFSRLYHSRPSSPTATATLLATLPRTLPSPVASWACPCLTPRSPCRPLTDC
jgi:hypothetical protein